MFSAVRPSSGSAGLSAGEIWQGSGVFGVETLLLPRTAALRTLNTYKGVSWGEGKSPARWANRVGTWAEFRSSPEGQYGFEPFILKPAVQTAKHAKYAKGNAVEWTRTFARWENPSSHPIRSAFAWFAYFAVPSAFSRFILSSLQLCRRSLTCQGCGFSEPDWRSTNLPIAKRMPCRSA